MGKAAKKNANIARKKKADNTEDFQDDRTYIIRGWMIPGKILNELKASYANT
ncbi:MAG TPA: hypothetical protein VGK59_10945 [Ohtaekwangia sp.]